MKENSDHSMCIILIILRAKTRRYIHNFGVVKFALNIGNKDTHSIYKMAFIICHRKALAMSLLWVISRLTYVRDNLLSCLLLIAK